MTNAHNSTNGSLYLLCVIVIISFGHKIISSYLVHVYMESSSLLLKVGVHPLHKLYMESSIWKLLIVCVRINRLIIAHISNSYYCISSVMQNPIFPPMASVLKLVCPILLNMNEYQVPLPDPCMAYQRDAMSNSECLVSASDFIFSLNYRLVTCWPFIETMFVLYKFTLSAKQLRCLRISHESMEFYRIKYFKFSTI